MQNFRSSKRRGPAFESSSCTPKSRTAGIQDAPLEDPMALADNPGNCFPGIAQGNLARSDTIRARSGSTGSSRSRFLIKSPIFLSVRNLRMILLVMDDC